jgi:hypothetical protein
MQDQSYIFTYRIIYYYDIRKLEPVQNGVTSQFRFLIQSGSNDGFEKHVKVIWKTLEPTL